MAIMPRQGSLPPLDTSTHAPTLQSSTVIFSEGFAMGSGVPNHAPVRRDLTRSQNRTELLRR